MNPTGNEKIELNDEVNLIDLLRLSIKFIKNAKVHIALGIFLGLVLGLSVFYLTKPIYESSMSAYSNNLSDSKAINVIEDLSKLLEQSDYDQIKQKTGLSQNMLSKVAKISVSRSKPSNNLYEETEKKLGFEITVLVYDVHSLDSLEYGIKNYIENIDFVRSRVIANKSSLAFNIEKLGQEITDMLILKENLNTILNNNNNNTTKSKSLNLFLSDLGNTNLKIIDLYEKQNRLKEELSLASDINIIKRFTKFKKRKAPRLGRIMIGSLAVGILCSILAYFWPSMSTFVKNS